MLQKSNKDLANLQEGKKIYFQAQMFIIIIIHYQDYYYVSLTQNFFKARRENLKNF